MTRKSPREIERAVEDLAETVGTDETDVELTDTQAKAIREYQLRCEHPSDLDDELEAALLEVVDDA